MTYVCHFPCRYHMLEMCILLSLHSRLGEGAGAIGLSCVGILDPQYSWFGKVIEPLWCGAMLREVHHGGWALMVYSLTSLPLLSTSYLWTKCDLSASWLLGEAVYYHDGLNLSCWNCKSKRNPFRTFFFVKMFYHSNRQAINTSTMPELKRIPGGTVRDMRLPLSRNTFFFLWLLAYGWRL